MATRYGDIIVNHDGSIGQLHAASKFITDNSFITNDTTYKKLTTITNGDGTVGTISHGQPILSSKYKKIQSIASKKKYTVSDEGGNNNIATFITKMQKYEFAPPSDNFWSVKIRVAASLATDAKETSLCNLYNNILEVHKNWNKKMSSMWKVQLPKNVKGDSYIEELDNRGTEIFLAQNVNFTPLSINTTNNYASNIQMDCGFLSIGNIVQGRNPHGELKIQFLVSNWNLSDILFDNWVAAIAKQGLIADSSLPNIKADIIITEYAIGNPPNRIKGKENHYKSMQPRKQFIFHNAFPVSRGSQEKTYEMNEAGTFKNSVISFKYDDYSIKYII